MTDVRASLKHYIDSRGIKISYISKQSKIPYNNISSSLNKKRKLSADEMLLICSVLNTDPNAVIDEYEKAKEK